MKKKQWGRLLAVILCAVTAFTTVACGDSKKDAKMDVDDKENKDAEEDQNEDNKENGETTVFTLGLPYAGYGNGIHTEKNAFLQLLKEELNVELDIVVYDSDSYAIMAATGDICDMMVMSGNTTVSNQIVDSGLVIPLDDLLEEYGQNITTNASLALEDIKRRKGEICYLPTHIYGTPNSPLVNGDMGFRARYDIYKAIGSPEINSKEDFLNVLKEMVEYERERTGADDVYAFSFFNDWSVWPYNQCWSIAQGYDGGNWNYTTMEYKSAYMDDDSAFWEGMEFYNEAYRMGLIDIDGMTQKNEQYKEKVANGKVLVDIYYANPDSEVCGEEAIMTYLPGYENVFSMLRIGNVPTPQGYGIEASRAISAKCENPELAMQVWDFMDSELGVLSLLNGVQGEDWEYDADGIPHITEALMEKYENGEASDWLADRTGTNFCVYSLYTGGLPVADEKGFDVILTRNEEYISKNVSAAQKAFAQDMDPELSFPGEVYQKWIEEGKINGIAPEENYMIGSFAEVLTTEETELYNSIYNEGQEYLAANIAKLIMAESTEEFEQERDKFQEKLREIGYAEQDEKSEARYLAALEKWEEVYGK